VELVDIQLPKTSSGSISSLLFKFVREYFESETISGRFVHPIYLQHQGHSRTIAGIEMNTNDKENLIIFDPGTRHTQIEHILSSINSNPQHNYRDHEKLLKLCRRSPPHFNKKKEYQLLLIRGAMESHEEYQARNSLLLYSIKIY
jgi:lipid A disaccharide synthetase